MKNPTEPTSIQGTITSLDGEVVHFSIHPEGLGWQQWGNTEDVCFRNTELLDALNNAASEHLQDEIEDDQEET